jgi:hypothetical protein
MLVEIADIGGITLRKKNRLDRLYQLLNTVNAKKEIELFDLAARLSDLRYETGLSQLRDDLKILETIGLLRRERRNNTAMVVMRTKKSESLPPIQLTELDISVVQWFETNHSIENFHQLESIGITRTNRSGVLNRLIKYGYIKVLDGAGTRYRAVQLRRGSAKLTVAQ